jgi:predicted phosphodiesterase
MGDSGMQGGTWKFVVIGDTRDEEYDTETGISPYLGELASGIAQEAPDLVLHNGDLINGYYVDNSSSISGNYTAMFANWKKAMAPIYDYTNGTGIPIYTVRGNHEDGMLVTDDELKNAYISELGNMMPQNGPNNEKGLTYTFEHNGAKFVMLDLYGDGDTIVDKGVPNQLWLEQQLEQNTQPFVIVMGHTPAFRVASNLFISPPPNLYNHPASRDRFWDSLADNGCKVYFCGHAHLYCRGSMNGVQQVVVGDCGAGFYDYDPAELGMTPEYPLNKTSSDDHKVGFISTTVYESNRTMCMVQHLYDVDSKIWSIGDQFTISVPSSTNNSADILPYAMVGGVAIVGVVGLVYWRGTRKI